MVQFRLNIQHFTRVFSPAAPPIIDAIKICSVQFNFAKLASLAGYGLKPFVPDIIGGVFISPFLATVFNAFFLFALVIVLID